MDILIPTFFMIIGVYYLKTYSFGKEAAKIKNTYGEEAARIKCKRGIIGGCMLVILSIGGYVLAFIR